MIRAAAQDAPAPPVATKLTRPGVNGVASIPPPGGVVVAEGFSREPSATGAVVSGLSGFYQYSLTRRLALSAVPTHYVSKDGRHGLGDTSLGVKFVLNHQTGRVPLFAVAYSAKQPTASSQLGTGFIDHKVTLYADKNFGPMRVTANFATRWEGHDQGFLRQYLPSLGVLAHISGPWGVALQTYYSKSKVSYGGAVAALTYHLKPTLSFHAGLEQGYGPRSPGLGFIAGVTFVHRPAR